MPELTWTTALPCFGVQAGAARIAAWVFCRVGQRQTTRLQADLHAATPLTRTGRRKGFSESQERRDQRWREAFERMDQRADDWHREVIRAIQALKG